jgi:pimeloyl-ACP methyl ester carboxylesterase
MDAAGMGRAHIVGNSLGGWIAMELARRGRARSAIAISPGGGWTTRRRRAFVRVFFAANRLLNWVSAPIKPFLFRGALIRRVMLRGVIERGHQITREQALAVAGDTLKVTCRYGQFVSLLQEIVRPYPDPGVPTLIAWATKDRLTPLRPDGDVWRDAAPHAEWRTLPGLGHLPMFDDPDAVTDLIVDFLATVP